MTTSNTTKECPHQNTKIEVLEAVCGCETTVEVCTDCGKKLIDTQKTEC